MFAGSQNLFASWLQPAGRGTVHSDKMWGQEGALQHALQSVAFAMMAAQCLAGPAASPQTCIAQAGRSPNRHYICGVALSMLHAGVAASAEEYARQGLSWSAPAGAALSAVSPGAAQHWMLVWWGDQQCQGVSSRSAGLFVDEQ